MTQETVTNGTEALFTREGMPPVKEMIPCALQHVLASFAGIITPAVIMAGVYGFNSQQSTDIIQVALILSAIDTALQAFAPFRRIGGGLPIGATLLGEKVQNVLSAGTHGSTFGGNPVCCAGAINVLSRLDEKMLEGVEERSAYIKQELTGAKGVLGVSGLGLMLGIQTEKNASDIIAACREKGVLVIKAKDKLRLLPALNIPMEQLQKAVAVIKACCAE